MNKSEQLIACLEGEIAKRDEELAACRVAVENCEVFRARIAELEQDLAYFPSTVRSLAETVTEREAEINQLRAELAAIKAQEPVWRRRDGVMGCKVFMSDKCYQAQSVTMKANYERVAPVSEARAQEPDCDRSACGDFSPGPCDNPDCSARRDRTVVAPAAKAQGVALDGSQLAGLLEQVRLDDDEAKPHGSGATYWNNAVIACQVAIRDALAAPVQQVSVPDGEDWGVFFGYLIDKCEGHIVAEENLQGWLSEMLADPHYGALFHREKTPAEQLSPIALSIEAAEEEHGSLRAAAKALGIDPGYLSRLKSGEKINPGVEVLRALGLERVTYYRAMLAAPAAPAADTGDVLDQAMYTLISIGYHENSGLVHELRQALAAHRAKGVA